MKSGSVLCIIGGRDYFTGGDCSGEGHADRFVRLEVVVCAQSKGSGRFSVQLHAIWKCGECTPSIMSMGTHLDTHHTADGGAPR